MLQAREQIKISTGLRFDLIDGEDVTANRAAVIDGTWLPGPVPTVSAGPGHPLPRAHVHNERALFSCARVIPRDVARWVDHFVLSFFGARFRPPGLKSSGSRITISFQKDQAGYFKALAFDEVRKKALKREKAAFQKQQALEARRLRDARIEARKQKHNDLLGVRQLD